MSLSQLLMEGSSLDVYAGIFICKYVLGLRLR